MRHHTAATTEGALAPDSSQAEDYQKEIEGVGRISKAE